jgi:hypothetical protein
VNAPGFNPCAYQVKTRFQAFAFKWVNLYRYIRAQQANMVPPAGMEDPEKIAAWKDEKMDRIKAEGARVKTEIMVWSATHVARNKIVCRVVGVECVFVSVFFFIGV